MRKIEGSWWEQLRRVFGAIVPPLLACSMGFSCRPVTEQVEDLDCDARELVSGEFRVRQVPCSDELLYGGEGRTGDYLLENAVSRYLFRDPARPLYILEGCGGTMIDASAWYGDDVLAEMLPLWHGLWLQDCSVDIREDESGAFLSVTGTLSSISLVESGDVPLTVDLQDWSYLVGQEHVVTYSLQVDDAALELKGVDSLWILPLDGVELHGSTLHDGDTFFATDGTITDAGGGFLAVDFSSIAVGDASSVYAALWPGGQQVAGTAEGEEVELLSGDVVVGVLPVADWQEGDAPGFFSGTLPSMVDGLRAVAAGHEEGPVVAPGPDMNLVPGDSGFLWLRVSDGSQEDIGALLEAVDVHGQELVFAVPKGGAQLPLGPGTWNLAISSGLNRERAMLDSVNLDGTTWIDVSLEPAFDSMGWILADLDLESWPSRTQRTAAADAIAMSGAQGASFAVLTAVDEITEFDAYQPWDVAFRGEAGSRAATSNHGTVVSWPWSPNSKKAAHGAVDWPELSAMDLLVVARGGSKQDRFLVVDKDWVEAAGAPWQWEPVPDLLRLNGLDDLPVLLDLLDQWIDIGVAGPWTWIAIENTTEFGLAEVERGIIDGLTVASSGPLIVFSATSLVTDGWHGKAETLVFSLDIYAPDWMDISGAALIVDGEEARSWTIDQEDRSNGLSFHGAVWVSRYLMAVAWGDDDPGLPARGEPWAVTSPVWIGSPTL